MNSKNQKKALRLALSFACLLVLAGFGIYFFQAKSVNPKAIIKDVVVTQTSKASVDSLVSWEALIKKSQITGGQHLVKLPKSARHIAIHYNGVKSSPFDLSELNFFTASVALADSDEPALQDT